VLTNNQFVTTVVAVTLFGDPTHRRDAPYNRGNGTGSGVFWRADISACEALGRRIRAYCDVGDQFCCVGPEINEFIHGTYLDRYSREVVRFVVDQYNKPRTGRVESYLPRRRPSLSWLASRANIRS
jgi:acetylxylan esterase